MNDGIQAVRRLAKLGYRAWVEGEVINGSGLRDRRTQILSK